LYVKYDPKGITKEAVESGFEALTDELKGAHHPHHPPQA